MVDVIKETFHVKEEYAAFESEVVCRLDVVEQCEASIEARGVTSSPKLGCGDELVLDQVVLETLRNYLFEEFGHRLKEGYGAVGLREGVVRFLRLRDDYHDGRLPDRGVITQGDTGVEDLREGVLDVCPALLEQLPVDRGVARGGRV